MAGADERLAKRLRERPPALDEVSRARMERRLVEAARDGAEPGRSRTRSQTIRRSEPPRRRARWIGAGVAVAAAAAVGLSLWMRTDEPVADRGPATATFQAFLEGESVRRGAFAEGETVTTAPGQRVEVRFPDARVDVTPRSVARFERVRADEMRIVLERGAVDVELHPSRPGEQQLVVSTAAARVEVVGTTFRVEVDDQGATTVRVEEGEVRVVPTDGSAERSVRGGSATRVAAPSAADDTAAGAQAGSGSAPSAGTGAAVATPSRAREGAHGDRAPATDGEPAEDGPAEAEPAEAGGAGDDPAESAGAEAGAAQDDPGRPSGPALSVDARFDLVQTLERQGRVEQARHVLYEIARAPVRRTHRVRAWHRLGDSYRREGDPRQAAEAYRRAADLGRGSGDGFNALYALARLRERELDDAAGARAAYRQYIDQAAEARLRGRRNAGPNLHQARQALCRLGEAAFCGE